LQIITTIQAYYKQRQTNVKSKISSLNLLAKKYH